MVRLSLVEPAKTRVHSHVVGKKKKILVVNPRITQRGDAHVVRGTLELRAANNSKLLLLSHGHFEVLVKMAGQNHLHYSNHCSFLCLCHLTTKHRTELSHIKDT